MITSTSNPKIKNIMNLKKKGKTRKEQDVFIVEGLKMFREAPEEHIVDTYVSADFYQKNRLLLQGIKVEIVDDRVFQSVSDTKTPQGILSVVKQFHYCLHDLLGKEAPHLLLLENLQDPGNLGTILRTAEGAGVTGIFMSSDTVDIYNPKTIRSTMGSVYRMPFLYVEDFPGVIEKLKERDISVYAAHLKGPGFYDEQNYCAGTAFMVGNEGNGLSDEAAALADACIRIPMCGQVESLNAAVAASILMYEVLRQRRKK